MTTTIGEVVNTIRTTANAYAEGAHDIDTYHIEMITMGVNNKVEIRDFLLGLPTFIELDKAIAYCEQLADKSEKNGHYHSVLASFYYEQGEKDKALMALECAMLNDPNQTLAKLLYRVFLTGWPTSEVTRLREDLHPKVLALLDSIANEEIA